MIIYNTHVKGLFIQDNVLSVYKHFIDSYFINTDGLGKPVNPNKALSSLKLSAQGGQ